MLKAYLNLSCRRFMQIRQLIDILVRDLCRKCSLKNSSLPPLPILFLSSQELIFCHRGHKFRSHFFNISVLIKNLFYSVSCLKMPSFVLSFIVVTFNHLFFILFLFSFFFKRTIKLLAGITKDGRFIL